MGKFQPHFTFRHALWSYRFGFGVEGMGQEFFSELRAWFYCRHAFAKARDGVRERNFGFPRIGLFYEGNIGQRPYIYIHIYIYIALKP